MENETCYRTDDLTTIMHTAFAVAWSDGNSWWKTNTPLVMRVSHWLGKAAFTRLRRSGKLVHLEIVEPRWLAKSDLIGTVGAIDSAEAPMALIEELSRILYRCSRSEGCLRGDKAKMPSSVGTSWMGTLKLRIAEKQEHTQPRAFHAGKVKQRALEVRRLAADAKWACERLRRSMERLSKTCAEADVDDNALKTLHVEHLYAVEFNDLTVADLSQMIAPLSENLTPEDLGL